MTAAHLATAPASWHLAQRWRAGWPLSARDTVIVFLIVAFACPVSVAGPNTGLDPSWALGLAWSNQLGLQFGPDIDFTYGPWGFTNSTVPLDRQLLVISYLANFALLFPTIASIRVMAKRAWPFVTWAGLVIVAWQTTPSTVVAIAVFTPALALVAARRLLWRDQVVLFSLGFLASLLFLIKVNAGITSTALVCACGIAVARRDWRRWLSAAAGLAIGAVGLFLLIGQSPQNLANYMSSGLQFLLGFNGAMSYEKPYPLLVPVVMTALLVATAALVAIVVVSSKVGRVSVGLMFALVLGAAISGGLGRADSAHIDLYILAPLTTTIIIGCVAAVGRARSNRLRAISLGIGLVTVCVSIILHQGLDRGQVVVADTSPITGLGDRLGGLGAWARYTFVPSAIDDNLTASRQAMVDTYQIAPEVLQPLAGRGVNVDPYEVGAAWAYGFDWRPVPVFQLYAAYTTQLDQRNADSVLSADGPDAILVDVKANAPYMARWVSPRYQVAVRCAFTSAVRTPRWEALVKSGNRCGAPVQLSSTAVAANQRVAVPAAPGPGLVVAEIDASQPGLVRLKNAFDTGKDGRLQVKCDGTSTRVRQGSPTGPLIVNESDAHDSYAHNPLRCLTLSTNWSASITFGYIPYLKPVDKLLTAPFSGVLVTRQRGFGFPFHRGQFRQHVMAGQSFPLHGRW